MDKIKLDPRNVRLHDQQNKQAISKSLKELGAGRSILVDNDNIIIGGNGVYEQAQGLGLPVRVIESDGTELIAIKRTDLASDDAKRKALAIADNKTGDLSFFDEEALSQLVKEIDVKSQIEAIGFNDKEIEKLLAGKKKNNSPDNPEVEFAEELLESHNFLVLYFDNDVDWLQAKTLFDIKTVKAKNSRPGYERRGIGRVLNGAAAINQILAGKY